MFIACAIHTQNRRAETGLRVALLNSAAECATLILQVQGAESFCHLRSYICTYWCR